MSSFTFVADDPALDLLNTRPDGGPDLLRTSDDLIRWMDQAGLIRAGGRPWRWNDKADPLVPRVKRLREAVRAYVEAAAAGVAPDAGAAQSWAEAGAGAPVDGGASGPEQLYAILARAAADLSRKDLRHVSRQQTPTGTVWVYPRL
jgi:predicted RNA-binding Zn ribbon-like protein